MSNSVENVTTKRYTKKNTTQPSLWGDEPVEVAHHHIEVIYLPAGHREVYCTANAYRPNRPGEWQWAAGFVGGASCAEECSICKQEVSA